MSKFDQNKFVGNLLSAFQTLNHSQSYNLVQALKKVVDIHAPYRYLNQKEKMLKAKPWLSSGLLKLIRHKNMHLQSHQI